MKALDHKDIVETIKVHAERTKGNPSGVLEINASDFDQKKHKKVDEEKPELELAPPLTSAFAPPPFKTA